MNKEQMGDTYTLVVTHRSSVQHAAYDFGKLRSKFRYLNININKTVGQKERYFLVTVN